MERRISKSNTNYHFQKHFPEHFLKKQSFDEEDWRVAALDIAATKFIETRSLNLFFQNPQAILSCRRFEHYANTQRLREGVYVLLRGRIRVLLSSSAKNGSKVDIEHVINKMERRPKLKCITSKLNIIEASQPYQVVKCTNNCLALPNTDCWFLNPEDLQSQQYYQRQSKLEELITINTNVFSVSIQLPFIFKFISATFRTRINLADDLQLAVIKKGSIRVQWRAKYSQQLIIAQGSVIIKNHNYLYSCESSEVQLIGILTNSTFKYIGDPLWTKSPQINSPELPKDNNTNQPLLFRSRSINLERLTSATGSRERYQKSLSASKDYNQNQLLTLQTAMPSPSNYRQAIKQNWLFMRRVQNYQIASNTRSELEYQRIQAIRRRFQREKRKSQQRQKQNQALMRRQPRGKIKFVKMNVNEGNPADSSHLFHTVNNFFNRQLSHHK